MREDLTQLRAFKADWLAKQSAHRALPDHAKPALMEAFRASEEARCLYISALAIAAEDLISAAEQVERLQRGLDQARRLNEARLVAQGETGARFGSRFVIEDDGPLLDLPDYAAYLDDLIRIELEADRAALARVRALPTEGTGQ